MTTRWSACSAPATSCCGSSSATSPADIHVRGNEITITGPGRRRALAARLFDELIELLRAGTELTADAVERSLAMLRTAARRAARPRC